MKNLSYSAIFNLSLENAKQFLFRPFSIKRWLKLLFIAAMAGQMAGGGGSAGDIQTLFNGQLFKQDVSTETETAAVEDFDVRVRKFQRDAAAFWDRTMDDSTSRRVFAVGVVLTVLLILLMMWFFARFNFVWLHCLMTGDIAIKKHFREYKKEGRSLFLFSLVSFFLTSIMSVLIVMWVLSVFLPISAVPDGTLFWRQNALGLICLALLVAAGVLFFFYINQLVVPIMAIKRIGIAAAWKEFKRIFKTDVSNMLLMPAFFLGLHILTGVLGLILVFAIGLAGLLIAAPVGGALYFLFNYLLAVQYAGNIVLIVLAVIWCVIVVIMMVMSQLPFVVFLRYFTLHFLASLDPAYNVIRPVKLNGENHLSGSSLQTDV